LSQQRFGGTSAPPLSDEKLASYRTLIETTSNETRLGDYLRQVLNCVERWWELPESAGTPEKMHPSGSGVIVELTKEIQKELFDLIPWEKDIESIQAEFETLPNGDLRNCAFHLLWHVKELNLDREPITLDKI